MCFYEVACREASGIESRPLKANAGLKYELLSMHAFICKRSRIWLSIKITKEKYCRIIFKFLIVMLC